MTIKKFAVTGLLLALSIFTAGIASAQGNPGQGNNRAGNFFREISEVITEETGLTWQEIREQMREDATLAEVITNNGSNVENVVSSAMTMITERVNDAVENERITQERADEILANAETRISDMLNHELSQRPGGNRPGGNRGARALVNAVAEATGLENTAIVEQVQAGNSLATILADNGVDVDSFVDAQLADYSARLTERVESGQVSQALADAQLNLRRVQLTEALNRVPEAPATITDAQA